MPEENEPNVDWKKVAAMAEFKALLAAKVKFILPATLFFILYYFALPILVGYAPALMQTNIAGVNLAYLFALSQFFMAWVIAFLYVRAAGRFDEMAKGLLSRLDSRKGGAKR